MHSPQQFVGILSQFLPSERKTKFYLHIKQQALLKLLCIVICRFYAARRDKVLIRTLLAGGARKVSSDCIILAVKNGASTMETISKSDLCDE